MSFQIDQDDKNKDPSKNGWVWLALTIYISFVLVYSICFFKSEGSNVLLSSNELGDFLAGIFSPVAFLFLILGYLQQKEVIAKNTKVLTEQIEELRLSKKLMVETNQPHFIFTDITQTHRAGYKLSSIRFKVKNGNQNCTVQKLSFLEDPERFTMLGDTFRFLPRSESIWCQVKVKNSLDYDVPETMFAIEYLDIFGNSKKLFYVLQYAPDKTVIYIAPAGRRGGYNANE